MSSAPSVLILGTAEWDAPIATNQHYVARELAQAADVLYVESLGLRRPTLRRDDVVRIVSRLRRALGHRSTVTRRPRPERTRIISPLVVPVHRAPTRAVNRALLNRATAQWLRAPGPRVLWAFTPVTYGLEAAADVVVYHCVDLLGAFPGVDAVAVDAGERRLASRTTLAIATSTAVHDHLVAAGFPRIIVLPNVADVSLFRNGGRPAAQREPRVLFSGNLSVHKLDVALLEAVARTLDGRGELLLAGPLGAGGGGFAAQLRRLEAAGARHLGLLTQPQLAEVAGTCAVGLIPYARNGYTRGVSPLKCFEYLASGLSVLATPLPAVQEVAAVTADVRVAEAGEFPVLLDALLAPVDDTVIDSRMAAADAHGWDTRGRVLRELLAAELHGAAQVRHGPA